MSTNQNLRGEGGDFKWRPIGNENIATLGTGARTVLIGPGGTTSNKACPDDPHMENSATSVRQRSATGNAEAGSAVVLKWGGLCEALAESVHQIKFVYSLLIPAAPPAHPEILIYF